MPLMIFVNLPVSDLQKSIAFYSAMGAENVPAFTDETAAMMRLSDTINIMLLTHKRFTDFTPKEIADSRRTTEVLLALSSESRAEVDATIEKAQQAGGVADPCPLQDHGFMYGRSYEDLDGHIFEVFWMDPAAIPNDNA